MDDDFYMRRAIELAKKGLYTARPNPKVGCVIVKDNQIVGEGFHAYAGQPHAETNALQQAGSLAKNATVYVTLEPCSHFGKTPPCAKALIDTGVSKVVIAMEDPNPQVGGQGIAKLQAHNIITRIGVLKDEAQELNKGYIKRMSKGLPYVRIKLAMSLDGRTAMKNGESKWITGQESRLNVQVERAKSCAILTGANTIFHDNANLTVRSLFLPDHISAWVFKNAPLRVVLDSFCRTPVESNVFKDPASAVLFCAYDADVDRQKKLRDKGIRVYSVDSVFQGLDLSQVLNRLAQLHCNEVLLEAGPTLANSMLQQGVIDEFVIYMAPILMGDTAQPLFCTAFEKLSDAYQLVISKIESIGEDWKITAYPKSL